MGHAFFLLGAAGAGKTTFCRNLREASKQSIKLINLDPAQENGADYDLDLCDHITVAEVMDQMDFGPNGALFYSLQEMSENLDELHLEDFENDFFVFDCPGQIELFLHSDILLTCINRVKQFSKVAIVYLIDSSNFMNEQKLLYTLLCSSISTYRMNLPVLTVVSKADLLDEETLDKITRGEIFEEIQENSEDSNKRLQGAITEYLNNNGMFDFFPVNWKEESSVENLLLALDNLLQKYDDDEPNEKMVEE